MRRYFKFFLLALTLVVSPAAKPARHYSVVHGWPVLPAGRALGSAAGVAVDAQGEVIVFHRAGRTWSEPLPLDKIDKPTLAVFDGRSGKFLREFGANLFAMPHGLSIDAKGDLWLTDVSLQQVFKLSAQGKVLMVLGEQGVAGNDAGHFNRPTQVAVAPDGSFFVSDGYRNTRVVHFTADGHFIKQWGTPGTGPGEFNTPHSIAIDRSGLLYVSDRQNDRVQVFDADGRLEAIWKSAEIGRPYGVVPIGDGNFAIADGGEQPQSGPDRSALVIVDSKGKVIERIGRYGNYDGQFRMAHHIAADGSGAIYVVDITGQRVQKFTRH